MAIDFPGYEQSVVLYKSERTTVYRAVSADTGASVILKALTKDKAHLAEEAVRYQQEYEIIKTLSYPEAIRALDFFVAYGSYVIVFEDIGAQSLEAMRLRQRLSVAEALALGCRIAHQLGELHAQGIVHKDITPANILWNRQKDILKIIDFGSAVRSRREHAGFDHPRDLEGTLAYMAPEQTGRTSRTVDYRTDLYSLGATLYALLIGHPPFTELDPLKLVHCHLAKSPMPPHLVDSAVPEPVSQIVMKLLAKTAEERYQSAFSVERDIERCRDALRAHGNIEPFPLAENDRAPWLQISEQLYGRTGEVASLLSAFEQAAQGGRLAVFIAGSSGIGKTAVVHQLYRPITEKRGLFLVGKYDQFSRDVPHSAVVAGFRGLIRQLLSEDEGSLSRWRERLLTAMGPNAQLIVDVIPEITEIIGPQPPVPQVPSAQAKARFVRVLQQFVRAFCSEGHPMVMFIDDLQWADVSSIELIEIMMTDETLSHCLFIGAYRDDELDPTRQALLNFQDKRIHIERISLGPLRPDDVTQLMADSLRVSADEVRVLASVVATKTGSSPFFIKQFMGALADENLLTVAPSTGSWTWDEDRISARNITDNLVDLLLERVRKLPEPTQKVLQIASLLGNSFDLKQLASALGKRERDVFDALGAAMEEGLVERLSRPVQSDPSDLSAPLIIRRFRFAHDRLQQACYLLIDEDVREHAHLQIGRMLWQNLGGHAQEPEQDTSLDTRQELFRVVGHLNRARSLIEDPGERRALAALNLRAGQAAATAQATEAAASYFAWAMAEVHDASWEEDRAFAYEAYLGKASAEARSGRIQQAYALLKEVWQRPGDRMQKARVAMLLVELAYYLADYGEARRYATDALALFGTELPREREEEAIAPLAQEVFHLLGELPIAALARLPATEDPDVIAQFNIIYPLYTAAFLSNGTLYGLCGLHAVRLALIHGVHAHAAVGFSVFGALLSRMGDVRRAAEAGQAAMALAERFGDNDQIGSICLVYGALLGGWVEHFHKVEAVFQRGQQAGFLSGSHSWVTFNMNNSSISRLLTGMPLAQLVKQTGEQIEFVRTTGNVTSQHSADATHLVVLNLLGKTAGPDDFSMGERTEADFLRAWEELKSNYSICHYFITKALADLLYDRPQSAHEDLCRAKSLLHHLGGQAVLTSHYTFYTGMTLARRIPDMSETDAAEARRELDEIHATLSRWAEVCPVNFRHMELCIAAERAALDDSGSLAPVRLYKAALADASAGGFVHHEAMIEERLAKLWLHHGFRDYASAHLTNARDLFLRWGALAKVAELQARYADLVIAMSDDASAKRPDLLTSSGFVPNLPHSLDVMTILRVSEALGSQLVLERLMTTLLSVAFENAGAERGTLLLMRGDNLMVEAEGRADAPEDFHVRRSLPMEKWTSGARSIANYVRRTRESVILGRAAGDARFQRDPYILLHDIRSIHCMPLISQGRLIGILYLENSLAYDAFTEERTAILRLIAGHMAIALENARLYADLQDALLEARESDRLKSEFLAMTSHELRTPLNALINIPGIILDKMEEVPFWQCDRCGEFLEAEKEESGDRACPACGKAGMRVQYEWTTYMEPGEIVPLLRDSVSSAQYLLAIVNSMLELSRLEFGAARLVSEEIAVPSLFDDVRKSVAEAANRRGVVLSFEVEDSAGAQSVWGDSVKVRQIVTNLVENAIKYSRPSGGWVRVKACEAGGNAWQLRVTDNGIGIPDESQKHIFESFRQVYYGENRSHGGVGLGLAITKKLCDLHGGSIRVISEVGAGSTFIVELPRAEATGSATEVTESEMSIS